MKIQHRDRLSAILVSSTLASLLVVSACSDSAPAGPATPGALRPGQEDSSKAFKGTPSKSESAFWEAIRSGDDVARAQAVTQLKADVAQNPSNGYSAFLAASDAFMPLADLLRATVNRSAAPKPRAFPDDTAPLLTQALQQLKDPFYIGFDATLLAGLQAFVDPTNAPKTEAIAEANNVPASSVGRLNTALRMSNLPAARDVMFGVLDFCAGTPLDHANPDVAGYVERANAASLVHRECYSGYHAMHGTEGILLITGDLVALAGNAELAKRFYTATQSSSTFGTWALKDLLERRLDGQQPAAAGELSGIVACSTCHINELK
ncbi:MAG TPA: hypothetical protein VNO55_12865 [Polyangia bacterium]|nr:hypothetical protein [Polyangia bacterium]